MDAPHLDSICTFKWKGHEGYRATYTSEHVNILHRMCRRHFPFPFEFICFTDDFDGIDGSITQIQLWDDHAHIPNPSGPKNPSCYRRLRMFDPDFENVAGRRFAMLDLDVVITGDLTPVFHRPEDIVLCANFNPQTNYNGSILLMSAGARPKVWETFDPIESPRASVAARQWGSDQGWISHCLGKGEATWTEADGVYSYRMHLRRDPNTLPINASIVVMHGEIKPWSETAQRLGWIQKHYL